MNVSKHDVTIEKIEDFICKNIDKYTLPDEIDAMSRITAALADLIRARTAVTTSDAIISHQAQNNLFSEF